jgi:hypothetical protein
MFRPYCTACATVNVRWVREEIEVVLIVGCLLCESPWAQAKIAVSCLANSKTGVIASDGQKEICG